jgi:hypothetical protein
MRILAATAFNIGNEELVKGLLFFKVSTDDAVIAASVASSTKRNTCGELHLLIECPFSLQQEQERCVELTWFDFCILNV